MHETNDLDMRLLTHVFRVTYADMPLLMSSLASVTAAAIAAAFDNDLIGDDEAQVATAFFRETQEGGHKEDFRVGVYAGVKDVLVSTFDNALYEYVNTRLSNDKATHLRQTLSTLMSTNARVRTACNLAYYEALDKVIVSCEHFYKVLSSKACELQKVVKPARLGLQDNLPITFGDEFRGYAYALSRLTERLRTEKTRFNVAAFGLSDVGLPDENKVFAQEAISYLSSMTGRTWTTCVEPFDVFVAGDNELIAHAKIQALSNLVWRIARDLRILCSGPRGGIQEITLPAVAPGSSIMPGKLNPVIAEMVFSTVDQVDANHATLVLAQKSGWLEGGSGAVMPVKAFTESADLLSRTMTVFADLCIKGIEANAEHCLDLAQKSLLCIQYVERLYGKVVAEKVFDKAMHDGCTVKEAAFALMDDYPEINSEEIDKIYKAASCGREN